jgi:hypothetical protein
MVWIYGLGLSMAVLPLFSRRGRALVAVTPNEPISNLHSSLAKRRSKVEVAALQAASDFLR